LGDTIFSHDAACPDATDGSLEVTVFGGTIPYTYLWNTSPPQITTTVSGLAPGTYKVFVTDSMGCKIVDTATVGALPLFTVTASPDQEMKKYSSVDLSFTISRKGIYQVSWSPQNTLDNPNSDNPVASPSVTTTYVIEVTQEGTGCRAEDSTVVVVLPTDYLFVPNAFSPNGDGINDLFYPLKGELVNITEFKIFDRWGNLVFDDPNGQWNGKSRSGVEMPVAAYAWYVEYTLDGQTYKEKGNVTLIR
jgi:gliding motility-associated-like protein